MATNEIARPTETVPAFQTQEMRRLDRLQQTLQSADDDPLINRARLLLSAQAADLCRNASESKAARNKARAALCVELNRIVDDNLLFKSEIHVDESAAAKKTGTLVESADNESEDRRRVSIRIVEKAFGPHVAVEPYPGPSPFNESDAFRFFGRHNKASEVVARVIANEAVLVSAPSGAGKTSLLHTSIVPELRDRGCRVLTPTRFRGPNPGPGIRNPFMHQALERWVDGGDDVDPNVTLAEFIQNRFPVSDDDEDRSPIVVVFDQFEELFTFFPEYWPMREDVFCQFRDAIKSNHLLRILMLIREDFAARTDRYAPILPDRLRMRIGLERLRRDSAIEAVARPLERTRCRFAPGVAESLVDKLMHVDGAAPDIHAEFVEPVQLQIVCRKLWSDLDPDIAVITQEHISELADVMTALGEYYDECIAAVLREHNERLSRSDSAVVTSIKEGELRTWFDRFLITTSGTKGIVLEEDDSTGGMPNDLVKSLEARYLLRSEPRGDRRLYELSHDRFVPAILKANARFRKEIARQAGDRFTHLMEKADRWEQQQKPEAGFLVGQDLVDAHRYLGFLDSQGVTPETHFAELVSASEDAEAARRLREQELTEKLHRRLLQLSFVALVITGCLFAWALVESQTAKRQTKLAMDKQQQVIGLNDRLKAANNDAFDNLSRMLVSDGMLHIGFDELPHAELLFEQAAGLDTGVVVQNEIQDARRNFWRSRLAAPIELFALPGQKSAAIDDAGQTILLNVDGTVVTERLDELGRRDSDSRVTRDVENVKRMQWQPRGPRFLTLSTDQTGVSKVQVWSRDQSVPLSDPLETPPQPQQFGLSEDGTWLFTSNDQEVRIHFLATNKVTNEDPNGDSVTIERSDSKITAVAFAQTSVAGQSKPVVFIGRKNSQFHLYLGEKHYSLVETSGEQKNPDTFQATVAEFSPDGQMLAVGCSDGLLRVWFLNQVGELNHPLVLVDPDAVRPLDAITRVVFSADSRRIAAVARQTAFVWDLASNDSELTSAINQSISILPHGALIYDVGFDSDGRLVATAGRDRTARVWEIVPSRKEAQMLGAPLFHPGSVSSCRFLSGDRLATANGTSGAGDGFAAIWKLPNYQDLRYEFKIPGRIGIDGFHFGRTDSILVSAVNDDSESKSRKQNAELFGVNRGDDNQKPERTVLQRDTRSTSLSPSGEHAIVVGNQGVEVHSTGNTAKSTIAVLPNSPAVDRAICHSGRRLALLISEGDGKPLLRLSSWSKESGKPMPLETQLIPGEKIEYATFSPTGNFVIVTTTIAYPPKGRAHLFRINDPNTGGQADIQVFAPLTHEQTVLYAAFNENESRIVTTSRFDNAKIWSIREMTEETPPQPFPTVSHTADIGFALFAKSNGREVLVTCSDDNTARVWSASGGDPITNELIHDGYVRHAAVKGGLLATASLDGSVRVWSLEKGGFVALLNHDGVPVHYVAFGENRISTVSSIDPDFTETNSTASEREISAPGCIVGHWNLKPRDLPQLAAELQQPYLEILAAKKVKDDNSLTRLETTGIRIRWDKVKSAVQKSLDHEHVERPIKSVEPANVTDTIVAALREQQKAMRERRSAKREDDEHKRDSTTAREIQELSEQLAKASAEGQKTVKLQQQQLVALKKQLEYWKSISARANYQIGAPENNRDAPSFEHSRSKISGSRRNSYNIQQRAIVPRK